MRYPIHTPKMLENYIVGLRKKAGLTQAQVGELLNLTQQSYQRLEKNPGTMSVARLMHVLKLLNATLTVEETLSSGNTDLQVIKAVAQTPVPEISVGNVMSNKEDADSSSVSTKFIVKATGKKANW